MVHGKKYCSDCLGSIASCTESVGNGGGLNSEKVGSLEEETSSETGKRSEEGEGSSRSNF